MVAAIAAALVLFIVANGVDGFSAEESGFATNGYGDRSPGGYNLLSAAVIEFVLTAVFLFVILGVTDTRAPKGFAPMAIGLALTLIHLASIPVTNTSVNPARSIGPALFAGADAIEQLWDAKCKAGRAGQLIDADQAERQAGEQAEQSSPD